MGKKKKNQIVNKYGKKYSFLLIVTSIVLIISLIQISYALSGGYVQEITKPFPFWKQYEVGFTTVNLSGDYASHYQYVHGLANVRGDLQLTGKVFSVNEIIDVDFILHPEFKHLGTFEKKFQSADAPFESSEIKVHEGSVFNLMMNTLPQNFFVVFLGAENVENLEKYNDRFAIINLTRNYDVFQFEGSGQIKFELDDERQILFLDPSQLTEFMSKRKEFTSDKIQFNLNNTADISRIAGIFSSDDAVKFENIPRITNLIDGKSEDSINISSQNVLSDLEQKNYTSATPGFVVLPITISFIVMIVRKILQNNRSS